MWLLRDHFDLEDYAAWVKKHPDEVWGPKPHLAWALDVARRPERPALLRVKHRHKDFAPHRKQYPAELKAKIVLEILKEEKSIAQIASEYGIHPSVLNRWRNTAVEKLPYLFTD